MLISLRPWTRARRLHFVPTTSRSDVICSRKTLGTRATVQAQLGGHLRYLKADRQQSARPLRVCSPVMDATTGCRTGCRTLRSDRTLGEQGNRGQGRAGPQRGRSKKEGKASTPYRLCIFNPQKTTRKPLQMSYRPYDSVWAQEAVSWWGDCIRTLTVFYAKFAVC